MSNTKERYTHLNPVRVGIVSKEKGYIYSSYSLVSGLQIRFITSSGYLWNMQDSGLMQELINNGNKNLNENNNDNKKTFKTGQAVYGK